MINLLEKLKPSANTVTLLYTVPDECQVGPSSIIVANVSSSNDTFRLAFVKSGETLSQSDYVAYDISITPGQFIQISELYFNTGDEIYIYAKNGNLTFTLIGILINLQRGRAL